MAAQGETAAAREILEAEIAAQERAESFSGAADLIGDLITLLVQQGDLIGARRQCERFESLTDRLDPYYVYDAKSSRAKVVAAAGDVPRARTLLDESSQGLQQQKFSRDATSVQYQRSLLALTDRPREALALARTAASACGDAGLMPCAAMARLVEVRALALLGEHPEAAAALKEAARVGARVENADVRLTIAVETARSVPALTSAEDAQSAVRAVISEAESRGLIALSFEGRLALGEILMRTDREAGTLVLRSLEVDSRRRGFGLVARRARAQMANRSIV